MAVKAFESGIAGKLLDPSQAIACSIFIAQRDAVVVDDAPKKRLTLKGD
ncbi:hypothetical protein [Pseudorhodoplanes sp.]